MRFAFVPVGPDSSFDYAVTFAERTADTNTIIDSVSFVDYIGVGETKNYTITPTEDGIWTFTSVTDSDTYGDLYDAEGNYLSSDDDNGQGNNFKIIYELNAGETYVIAVRYYSSDRAGSVALIFDWEPVNAD